MIKLGDRITVKPATFGSTFRAKTESRKEFPGRSYISILPGDIVSSSSR